MKAVTPFRPEHIDLIQVRSVDLMGFGGLGDMTEVVHGFAAGGPAFTFWIDDQVAHIAGIVYLAPGVGEIWAVSSDLISKYPLWITRRAQELLSRVIESQSLRRVQASIPAAHRASLRWAEHMGFEREGLMRKYGSNGEDFIRMARVA